MKITKPLKLGLLHRTYTQNTVHKLVVKPLVFFELDKPRALVSEQEGWTRLAVGMPDYQALDEVMPKAFPEVVLTGFAHSPAPVTNLRASLKIGDVEKHLSVTGDRIWQKRWYGYRTSPAAAFTSMPIDWYRAFGNKDFTENPVGLGGVLKGSTDNEATLIGLPNIEYANDRLTRQTQQIKPASFGPIHPTWDPRVSCLGDFDQSYIDHVFPDMPEDMDLRRFNISPADQQMASLVGDELYQLDHLHPDIESLTSSLPGVRARAFVGDVGALEEISLAAETVWFLPEINLGVLIYCGEIAIAARHASLAVNNLLLAYEYQEATPREHAYYDEVLALRTDEDTALAHVFEESQLSPVKSEAEQTALVKEHADEVMRLDDAQSASFEKVKKRYQQETGQSFSDEQAPTPVNPQTVVAPAALARADFSLAPALRSADTSIEEAKAVAEKERASLNERSGESITESDDEIIAQALKRTDGSYEREAYAQANEYPVDSSQEGVDVVRLELKALAMNQSVQPLTLLKSVVASGELRSVVVDAMRSDERLSFRDFTGADLSGLDFSGNDLRGTLFECANLSGANLRNCNLEGASLLAANLDATDFSRAALKDANLSSAYGRGTIFNRATISGSVLMRNANLTCADFGGSNISGLIAANSKLRCCDFSAAVLTQAVFNEVSFEGAIFSDTQITMSQFMACDLKLSEWYRPSLERSVFINSQLQLMNVEEGSFVRCQIAGDTFATGSDFKGSEFIDCGLRSLTAGCASFSNLLAVRSDFAMSKFLGSNFVEACFSECLANVSDFSFADFNNALISSTNLTGSLLVNCNLQGTDFFESDVLLADFSNSEIDQTLNMMQLKEERIADERRRIA